MSNRTRMGIGALTLSAAALVAIWDHEGWTERAVIPVEGDVPTVGPGLTKRADGSPVQMGDTIKPLEGARRSLAHIQADEAKFKASLPGVELHPKEYDLYLDWMYQYGHGAWAKSSMRRHLLTGTGGHYAACRSLLAYSKVAGYDCSTPFNKRCGGVWTRQLDRFAICYAAQ